MASIFLQVGLVKFLQFWVLSFTKSNWCDFNASDKWLLIYPTSVHWIIKFGAMLQLYAAIEVKKTVHEFKDALQLI